MIGVEDRLSLVLLLLAEAPKKLPTLDLLCVPFCHLQDARHVNLAACWRAPQCFPRSQQCLRR